MTEPDYEKIAEEAINKASKHSDREAAYQTLRSGIIKALKSCFLAGQEAERERIKNSIKKIKAIEVKIDADIPSGWYYEMDDILKAMGSRLNQLKEGK